MSYEEKATILAIFGRGAIKFALVPVVGLSLVSSSLSNVFAGFIKVAATPFAIVYTLGSMFYFCLLTSDFRTIFTPPAAQQRLPRPQQRGVRSPPHSGRGEPRGAAGAVRAPANQAAQVVQETPEERAHRLLKTMILPKKRFDDERSCAFCLEDMEKEEEVINSVAASHVVALLGVQRESAAAVAPPSADERSKKAGGGGGGSNTVHDHGNRTDYGKSKAEGASKEGEEDKNNKSNANNKGGWNCSACTFLNDNEKSQECSVCGTKRASASDGNPAAAVAKVEEESKRRTPTKVTFLPCGHGFHSTCCVDLVKANFINAQCPICRAPLFNGGVGRNVFL